MSSEIRDLRTQAGLSQMDLSCLSGVTQTTISLIERGKIDPRTSTVNRLKSAIDKHNLARASGASVPAVCEVRGAGFSNGEQDE
jgi:predicted transcriptional regulator